VNSKCNLDNTSKQLLFTQVAHSVRFTQLIYAKISNKIIKMPTMLNFLLLLLLSLLSIQYDVIVKQIITDVRLRQCVVIPACIRGTASIGSLACSSGFMLFIKHSTAADVNVHTIRYAHVKCAFPVQIKPLFTVSHGSAVVRVTQQVNGKWQFWGNRTP